jgi:hypothetical protein|tara:strand:+ start:50 stop:334 length:285 start_codon:yes stop_codon:yes gene_type:complete
MICKKHGAATEIQFLSTDKPKTLFFSYETLVGVQYGSEVAITDFWHSGTTTKQINKWLSKFGDEIKVTKVDPKELSFLAYAGIRLDNNSKNGVL